MSFALFAFLFFGSSSLAQLNAFKDSTTVSANSLLQPDAVTDTDLFFNQREALAMETPDLKISQDSFIAGISTPNILTTQTLGSYFGEATAQERKDVVDYEVEAGDTVQSVAAKFNISTNTLLWANELNKGASLKVGQNLTILPVSGVIHTVVSGNTVSAIAQKYKAKAEDIIAFNNLQNEGDIFIGDMLVVPGGTIPQSAPPAPVQTQLADSFFITPTEGRKSQGLHYSNANDIANKCGTPIHAAAGGVVQRSAFHYRYGNFITILHSNGVVTYYGHLQTMFVKSGDTVAVGDRIATMGSTGTSATGCHLHFGVYGATNPLTKYPLGSVFSYK